LINLRAMRNLIFIALFLVPFACKPPQTHNQGILKGELQWVAGNQMPGPDKPASSGIPIQRVVLIYPPIQRDDCTLGPDGLFTNVPGKPVARILSDTTGNFITNLGEGMYSVFTREKDGIFASISNGEGIMNPVTITARDTTEIRIDINYKASY